MTDKKLLTANYIYKIECKSGFLFWKSKYTEIVHWDAKEVIYNTEDFAQKFFENYDTYFRADTIPDWYHFAYDIPRKYVILEKKCQVVELDHNLEYLKNNMMSKDFLEYCNNKLGIVESIRQIGI